MRHFTQFLDDLPDRICKFLKDHHIHSFGYLTRYTKEDLLRKKMQQDDVNYLAATLFSYFYELKSDDDLSYLP